MKTEGMRGFVRDVRWKLYMLRHRIYLKGLSVMRKHNPDGSRNLKNTLSRLAWEVF